MPRSASRPKEPVFSSAPTERWQHGSEAAPQMKSARSQPQRLHLVTERLVATGKLRPSDHMSALRWLRDFELGVHGATADPCVAEGVSVSVGGYDRVAVGRVDALTRHREATAAVGAHGNLVLVAAVAQARTLASLASEFSPSDSGRPTTDVREVTGLVVATVTRLSEHYEAVDSSQRRRAHADYVPAVDRAPRRGNRGLDETLPPTAGDVQFNGRSAWLREQDRYDRSGGAIHSA